MAQDKKQTQIEEIDFKDIFLTILRKWYIFVIIGAVVLPIAVYTILSSTPKYLTEASVIVQTQDDALASTMKQFSLASYLLSSKKIVNDEIIIFQSKTLSENLIKTLDLQSYCTYTKRFGKKIELYNNEPITVTYPKDFKDNIIGSYNIEIKKQKNGEWDILITQKIGFKKIKHKTTLTNLDTPIETQWGTFSFTENAEYIDPKFPNYNITYTILALKPCVQNLSTNLSTTLSNKKANAITLKYIGGNINKNETIINTIIDLYQQLSFEQKLQNTIKLESFLTERINSFDKELKIIEKEIEEFRTKNNLADITLQSENSLEASLEYSKLLTEVDMELTVLSFMDDFLKKSNEFDLIPTNTIADDETLSQLIVTHNLNITEYLRLKQSTTDNNPYLLQLKEQILASRKNILQTINNMKEGATLKRSNLSAKYTEINNQINNVPAVEREFLAMKREQETKQKLYLFLLQKKEETQFVATSSSANELVIDKAFTFASPVSPNSKQTLAIAIILTLALGCCYIYIESLLDTTISHKSQIISLTNLTTNDDCPIISKCEFEYINNPKYQKEIELLRSLRTTIQLNNSDTKKTILVTTATAPKTNTYWASINLALSFANLRKKTVLVNLNLQQPTNTIGISEYLWSDDISLESIIQPHNQNQYLSIIPTGANTENSTEILNSDKLNHLIETLRKDFDYIILDTTPIDKKTLDTLLFSNNADITLFVCKKNVTKKSHIKELNRFIERKLLNNVTIVFERNV